METKKQVKWFTIFDYEKEQDYLREMHKHGWKFVKVTGIGMYHFEKCEPQDVVYQLDYNAEGLANKAEYLRMFADCGWEYLQDFFGYSYFRKPVDENGMEDEIFCDEESKFQMMQRVIKGRMLPLLIIFFAVLLPQLLMSLSNGYGYVVDVLIGAVLGLYLTIFVTCLVKYMQYKNRRG